MESEYKNDFNITKQKHQFYERHFLNTIEQEHSGSAKLDFLVRRKGTKAKGYVYSLWGQLEIRDCSRRIDLAFDGNTKTKKDELENSRLKLEKLKSIAETGLAAIDAMKAAHVSKNK